MCTLNSNSRSGTSGAVNVSGNALVSAVVGLIGSVDVQCVFAVDSQASFLRSHGLTIA